MLWEHLWGAAAVRRPLARNVFIAQALAGESYFYVSSLSALQDPNLDNLPAAHKDCEAGK